MNADDFEKRLQRQPFRQVPADWRENILSPARRAPASAQPARTTPCVPSSRAILSTLKSQLLAFLWPSPQAWAALAVIWVALLAFNLGVRFAGAPVASRAKSSAPQVLMAWQEQNRLLAELIGPPDTTVADRPKPATPRPRSERRPGSLPA